MHWTLTSSIFGSEDIRPDVDVIIILGNLTIYTNIHPKLLLLRFSGMLANVNYSDERRNQIARDLYHHLWPFSGRQGYEVVRRGGSSGTIRYQSNPIVTFLIVFMMFQVCALGDYVAFLS
jgi:hypothetical protein